MPSIRKAARGKRRWVGIKIDRENTSEDALMEKLALNAGRPRVAWASGDGRFVILEVRLENYEVMVEAISTMDYVKSITSSGKIRLVKSRIYQIYKSS